MMWRAIVPPILHHKKRCDSASNSETKCFVRIAVSRVKNMTDKEVANRERLRPTVATLAYRAAKAVRGATPEFAAFRIAESSRTPAEILAHMGDLFDWALSIAQGEQRWNNSKPLAWDAEVQRFFAAL